MTTEIDMLLRIIDSAEALVNVVPLIHVDLPRAYAAIRLRFSVSTLWVSVNPDDDSLVLSETVPPSDTVEISSVADRLPWASAIGSPILWAWRMINHQGYFDGVQIAFLDRELGRESTVIQMMGRASMVVVGVVSQIETSHP
jgi:hypothetical protein